MSKTLQAEAVLKAGMDVWIMILLLASMFSSRWGTADFFVAKNKARHMLLLPGTESYSTVFYVEHLIIKKGTQLKPAILGLLDVISLTKNTIMMAKTR